MSTMRSAVGAFAGFVISVTMAAQASAAEARQDPQVARGRYLVVVSGCNDCHTPGYLEKAAAVPEQEWLTGQPVGYQGPWGTTYASNLRLVLNSMSEAQWLEHARKERLPPMPWFNLREMTEEDLKAVHAYVRSLGSAGTKMPAYVAPGGKVSTPYYVFVPQVDQKQATAR